MMYSLLRKILFQLNPETAHHLTLELLRCAHLLKWIKPIPTVAVPQTIMNLCFPNPIGLAAGLDKNGDYIDALAAFGFGFIEIGTVTPKPQTGNPRPRLFRLIEQEALINRLGFNNKGLEYVVSRLQRTKYKGILGINIGKNRDTPLENALDDYTLGFRCVAPYASYVTINISSPNTPALRELQHESLLRPLLQTLKQEQAAQQKYVPLVVKIAPDLTSAELEEIATVLLEEKIDGVIATNTTIHRNGVEHSPLKDEIGGLSGKPLFHRSTAVIKQLHELLGGVIPIIGCGGISDIAGVQEKMAAGASLLQLYTGLIYHGPQLIADLIRAC